MSGFQKQLRSDLRAAIAAHARFAGFDDNIGFPRDFDADGLPFFVVRTPRKQSSRAAYDVVDRTTLVTISLRRKGGDDLEDQFDDDEEAIEALVLPILEAAGLEAFHELTESEVLRAGGVRFGQVDLTFRVIHSTG